MLQAMNTGHDGSLTTIHANNSEDVILRLEVLVQMAGADLPISSIHRQIASAIDLIVQLTRLRNGRRCVSQVSQVVGIDEENGGVKLKDIFLMDTHDEQSELVATGSLPSFIGELIEARLIDLESFYQ
jgi:pilus assembly protein CpaF